MQQKLMYISTAILLTLSFAVSAEDSFKPPETLRVCADPNNMPFSNKAQEGFENKIAQLMADSMQVPLEFTWFPQRMGFIRNTLMAWSDEKGRYKCDLVIGVPKGFDISATTKPYYRSTYALIYVKGRGLDDIKTPQALADLPEARKKDLKIGMFAPAPSVDWLLKNGLIHQSVSYQIMTGDPDYYAGKIIEEDLISSKLNMAFVWGPIAGYFAYRIKDADVMVLPMKSEPEIKFDFSMAMGIRRGEPEWKAYVESLIDKHRNRIHSILREYHIPLVNKQGDII